MNMVIYMIQRHNKVELKKIIKKKLMIGLLLLMIGVLFLILIENIQLLNNIGLQIISVLLILSGMAVLSLIGIELNKIGIENSYLELEKYIEKFNNHIAILYKMHMNGKLEAELKKCQLNLSDFFPSIVDESYELEIVDNNKKMTVIFYPNRVIYTTWNLDKYAVDLNKSKWNEVVDIVFESEGDIISFILKCYNNCLTDSNK